MKNSEVNDLAELRGPDSKSDKNGICQPGLRLCPAPVDWRQFNDAFVMREERFFCHALPEAD